MSSRLYFFFLFINIKFSLAIILKYSNLTLSNQKPNSYGLKNEEKLINLLLQNYNPNVIPRPSLNESLKLYVGLSMAQLINIVSKKNLIK